MSGLSERTISPAAPPTDGVAIPTVIFLATLASPCKFSDTASIPSFDVDVILFVKIVGPLNSDDTSLFAPPLTLSASVSVL